MSKSPQLGVFWDYGAEGTAQQLSINSCLRDIDGSNCRAVTGFPFLPLTSLSSLEFALTVTLVLNIKIYIACPSYPADHSLCIGQRLLCQVLNLYLTPVEWMNTWLNRDLAGHTGSLSAELKRKIQKPLVETKQLRKMTLPATGTLNNCLFSSPGFLTLLPYLAVLIPNL